MTKILRWRSFPERTAFDDEVSRWPKSLVTMFLWWCCRMVKLSDDEVHRRGLPPMFSVDKVLWWPDSLMTKFSYDDVVGWWSSPMTKFSEDEVLRWWHFPTAKFSRLLWRQSSRRMMTFSDDEVLWERSSSLTRTFFKVVFGEVTLGKNIGLA